MNKKTLLMVFVPMFLFGSIFVAWAGWVLASQPKYEITKRIEPVDQDVLFESVQNWRLELGKEAYIADSQLCEFANKRVKEIQSDFSHSGYRKMAETEIYKDGRYSKTGENLSEGVVYELELLNKWLTSPSHRDNLEDDFTHSCVRCENNYCVQIFGKLLSSE